MTTELARVEVNPYLPVVRLVTDAAKSPHTARAYGKALEDFMLWREEVGNPPLTKATVQRHVKALQDGGRGGINIRLAAIKKLAREAADNGLLDDATVGAIGRVEGNRTEGQRLGNWLSKEKAQTLLESPDTNTLKGLRDRAILAVLLGTGLRRQECASLTVEHIQQREGRWVIVDLVGKRNKMRSVPMPSFAKYAIDAWLFAAGVTKGLVFRATRRGGHLQDHGMTAQSIFEVVTEYAAQVPGLEKVRPHDLRRTFAQLAHKGDAPIEQIQLSLGHSSLQTTERYLGVRQDLTSAPCDVLGLKL